MESTYCLTEDILNWLKESRSLGVFTTDKRLNIKSMNEWLQTRSQFNPEEFAGRYLFEVYPEIVNRKLYDYYNQTLQGQMMILSHDTIEYLVQLPSHFAGYKYMQQNVLIAPLIDMDKIAGTITIIDDVTRKNLISHDEKLFDKDELPVIDEWQLTFDAIPDLIAIIDKEHRVKRINKAMADALGIKPEDAIGKHCYKIVHNTTSPPFFCPHTSLLIDKQSHSSEFYEQNLKKYLSVTVIPYYDADKNLSSSIHIARDISERVRTEQLLKNLSFTDGLTGLYNRRGFITLTKQLINTSSRLSCRMLLLFVDVNGMKLINDIFGHLEGDHALRSAAKILKGTFRETDVIGRYGGDEFIVSAMLTGDLHHDTIMDRLNHKVNVYNTLINKTYKLSFSIGIAVYDPNNPATLEELISQSDAAMYQAKYRSRRKDTDAEEEE
jgi:diguanylate cyclase (GGDEF)-like protein/PAS domain S-box-containing protein